VIETETETVKITSEGEKPKMSTETDSMKVLRPREGGARLGY